MKEVLAERDVEVRIMKRERDETVNARYELYIENKNLKVI
jgi:hypothetical protein